MRVLRIGFKKCARSHVVGLLRELTGEGYKVAGIVEVRVKPIAERRAKQGYAELHLCREAIKVVFLVAFHGVPIFGYFGSAV